MGMKRRGFSSVLDKNDSRHESFMEKGRSSDSLVDENIPPPHSDRYNYALLIALYTLQGIPMGLSASIPFLIQQKIKEMASIAAAAAASTTATAAAGAAVENAAVLAATTTKSSYNANAIFALCAWPFSLKLLWAPIVDALFFKRFGRRKTWLVPVQSLAGILMVLGADFVQDQLGLTPSSLQHDINVKGVTCFFFVLYFLMATQDVAVDGYALTLLSKENRGRGPVCNSIGQNLGYFLSFVGFLALNDAEASEKFWRPLLKMPSQPGVGLVSLGGFLKYMGCFMLVVTTYVAIFQREVTTTTTATENGNSDVSWLDLKRRETSDDDDDDAELDAAQLGLHETYHRLWCVCQLPAVQWLFLLLLTYRLPTALSDNVKFLKAVDYGLSKSTTALLSPTVVLPLGILVPIVASKIWHGHPFKQFMAAYKLRVTLVPLLDVSMLHVIRQQEATQGHHGGMLFWFLLVSSTAMQAICNSLQFNAQMTFFASRVDPMIGGSYMTLLNTAANLGGTWPNSFVMYLVGLGGDSSYVPLQAILTVLGCCWIFLLGPRLNQLADLPSEAWRTELSTPTSPPNNDLESPKSVGWRRKDSKLE